MSTSAIKRLSVDDYLALERASTTRHEYYDGEIFAMAGGTEPHNLVAANFGGELRAALRTGPCRVYPSDMRVVLPTGLRTYPDVSVVCERPEFEDATRDTLLNPIIVVEVLSPSTESYDRGKKFEHYRTCPCLREYVLVSQDRVLVEHYARQNNTSQWLMTAYSSIEDLVRFSVIEASIAVREIYAKVEFPPPSEDDVPSS